MMVDKKEPQPKPQHLNYDDHHMQTVVLQWQPNAKKWCHSGDVATGRDIDTRGWEYVAPCPMPE